MPFWTPDIAAEAKAAARRALADLTIPDALRDKARRLLAEAGALKLTRGALVDGAPCATGERYSRYRSIGGRAGCDFLQPAPANVDRTHFFRFNAKTNVGRVHQELFEKYSIEFKFIMRLNYWIQLVARIH